MNPLRRINKKIKSFNLHLNLRKRFKLNFLKNSNLYRSIIFLINCHI